MMSVDLFVKGLPEYLTYCENLVYGGFPRSNQFIYNGLRPCTQYCRINLICNVKEADPAIISADCGISLFVEGTHIPITGHVFIRP